MGPSISSWLLAHEGVLWALIALSFSTFVISACTIPVLIARMPADYFLQRKPSPQSWRGQHPVIRTVALILKNLLGLVFLVLGIAMLVLPGQGIITILIGISLLNLPGKRNLEIRILRQPVVLRGINWMRAKANRSPLRLPRKKRAKGLSVTPGREL